MDIARSFTYITLTGSYKVRSVLPIDTGELMLAVLELLIINFNSLSSYFPKVITIYLIFSTFPVTIASIERNISEHSAF